MKKLLIFIINPCAGNGRGTKVWKKIKRELQRKNVHFRSFLTERPGHAEDLAKQMAHMHQDHLKGIIAIGGDGTVHEVINGLVHHDRVPVGFISAGSGNDFARGYHIPKSPIKALNRILSYRPIRVKRYDLGEYRLEKRKHKPGYFASSLGVGFDGEVTKQTNQSKSKGLFNKFGLGTLAYVYMLLKVAMTYKPFHLDLTIDGREYRFEEVWFATTTNIEHFGGGMKISPGAKPNDGILNICIVHNLSRSKLFFLFGTVFFGIHTKLKEVEMFTGKEIELSTMGPVTVHADGEVIGQSPVNIEVKQSRSIII
ncbi:diacylglycerol kinase family protein [Alkalihalobacillus sp. AL-G]|uniref:diacylglycerol/lipid kinase family protein n=1 Tax=Alkalihalobacillus sp. AL-G TaxID=2926399 RepID=UPI00272B1A06|nr:diacylglycerol kinase family protein [Alkalihalobacillus sp. AL-G]WLD92425.1 diacylglycerol kinase family lipid kinase [Alkalihalobacillus sp. AL-G]